MVTDPKLQQFGAPLVPFNFSTAPNRASVGTLMLTGQPDGSVHAGLTLDAFFQVTDPMGDMYFNREPFVLSSNFDVFPNIPTNPFGKLNGDGLNLVNSSGTVGATLQEVTVNTAPEPSTSVMIILGVTCVASFVLSRQKAGVSRRTSSRSAIRQ
jgi:hypothetical protein